MNKVVDEKIVAELLIRAKEIESKRGTLNGLYKRYREIFFMTNGEQPKDRSVDRHDWQVSVSPNGRNAVIGIKRLLDTSDIYIKVLDRGKTSRNSDKIEVALKKMLDVSSDGRNARVLSDAILSATLYGPVILAAESVGDLLELKGLPAYKKMYLKKLQKRTPMLIKTLNAEEHYLEHDEGMLIFSEWKYKLLGSKVKSRFGKNTVNDSSEYEVRDIFTPDYHIVSIEGVGTVFASEHGMGCIPIVVSVSGGTELFHKPEEQQNSFLYAKVKGNFDVRENALQTTIWTNIDRNGLLGDLYWIKPDNAPEDIRIEYQNGVRIAKGEVSNVNSKILDPVLFQLKNMLDEIDGQSTIYKQTLGENINAGTFSSLAMLSSAGKLPLVDPQRAVQNAFKGIFEHILYRIKNEGIDNELIKPMDIPDDVELEVTLEPKLPQDNLRNSQMAMNLGGLVSDQWKHEQLLQIGDSDAMSKQVMKETLMKSMMAKLADPQNPIMEQLMQFALGGFGQQKPTPPQGNKPPQGQPPMMPPMQEQPNPAMQPEGMQPMEQTDPMIPQEERM